MVFKIKVRDKRDKRDKSTHVPACRSFADRGPSTPKFYRWIFRQAERFIAYAWNRSHE